MEEPYMLDGILDTIIKEKTIYKNNSQFKTTYNCKRQKVNVLSNMYNSYNKIKRSPSPILNNKNKTSKN